MKFENTSLMIFENVIY